MDSMVERVARALANDTPEDWQDLPFLHKLAFNAHARAAIEAMMEPTPAMIDRFVSRALCVSIHSEDGWSNYARNQWQAMIAGALAGTGEKP